MVNVVLGVETEEYMNSEGTEVNTLSFITWLLAKASGWPGECHVNHAYPIQASLCGLPRRLNKSIEDKLKMIEAISIIYVQSSNPLDNLCLGYEHYQVRS